MLTTLTYAQMQLLKQLQARVKSACPACGSADLEFRDTVQLGCYREPLTNRVVGTDSEQMARRVCTSCGYVMLFDLSQLNG